MKIKNLFDDDIASFLKKKQAVQGFLFFFQIFLIISSQLIAQQNSYNQYPIEFNHYTTEEGLVHNSVNCIAQDTIGFLWIGSNTGVERFDGYNFTVYKPQKDDINSLKGTIIWALYNDSDNTLWVGAFAGGLSKYNREEDDFTNYFYDPKNPKSISSDNVSCIFQDLSGRFWVGTKGGGINLFDKKKVNLPVLCILQEILPVLQII